MAQPVFYDPLKARWKRIRLAFDLVGLSITLLIVFFAYTALRSEPLPDLLLPAQKRPFRALLKEKEKEKAKERRRLAAAHRGHRKSKSAPSQVKLNAEEGIRAAYYVPYDAASFSSLREYARQIDLLFPDWLHAITPDGRLQSIDEQTNKFFDLVQGPSIHPVDEKVMPFLSTDKYHGLMIDFETFSKKGQAGYLTLLQELSDDLHAKGMKLYVSVQARNSDYNYAATAAHVDGVVLMNYDEHYPSPGLAGPVASQDWFTDNLKAAIKVIPQDKLISAIGNYGYDWVQKPKHRSLPPGVKDINVSAQAAWLTARDSEADVDLDGDSLNPHISYVDEHDLQHEIWFLDAVTALNQMRAAQVVGIKTFALWRLGSEDRSLWRIWDIPGEAGAENKLKDVPPGQDVDMEGNGEILRIEARPADGQRSITLDQATGLITDESFDSLPEPYRMARYGSSPDKVAITFDDGPDPEWTPKILDVLKREQAPAAFFLIGIQADKFSDVTKRIYREGHEIGNHTFTHPDISNVSRSFMRTVELNLTEQLFASLLGMRTILFRPPYSIDAEPDTEDQVRPLETTQEMGYITVGDKIDPNDWRDSPRHSADQIAADVLAHLPPCAAHDTRCGNIILMHDGGGDREQTVLALPMIIAGVREKGLRIVPLAELLGRTRADVMPPIPANQRWTARLNLFGFALFPLAFNVITWIFFVGDVLMTGRLFFIGAFAIFDRLWPRRYGTHAEAESYLPRAAVLIPAYNEEKVIERTIRAALAATYPNVRVIVIDDGSGDKTLEVARAAFAREEALGKVLILTKPNSGKADALNFGLEHLRDEEIFIGIDADTLVASDAISRLVPHFLNPKVGAVAGNAKVGNRVNLWTRWQALEYITSQNFERRALNTMGAVSVVPGAIGAWRTTAVREAGGYHTDTVAEDADLTMALLERGYRVEYEDRALAFTEAPINARGLMRQRFRWSFGILQAVWKHRGVMGRKGALGWIALPNIVIFQILLPLVSPFIDLMFSVGAVWYYIQKYFHPESADPASFQRLVMFFVAFLVIDFFASAIAFALERRRPDAREDAWLLSQVWLQRFAYRQLFSVVLLKTLKRAIEGQRFAWDKLERTASMSYRPAESRESVKVP